MHVLCTYVECDTIHSQAPSWHEVKSSDGSSRSTLQTEIGLKASWELNHILFKLQLLSTPK